MEFSIYYYDKKNDCILYVPTVMKKLTPYYEVGLETVKISMLKAFKT